MLMYIFVIFGKCQLLLVSRTENDLPTAIGRPTRADQPGKTPLRQGFSYSDHLTPTVLTKFCTLTGTLIFLWILPRKLAHPQLSNHV